MKTVPTITAQQAQAIASRFLSDHLPDRFAADQPQLTDTTWRVPVILSYPSIGAIGQVGELLIKSASEEIISHTPLQEMKAIGLEFYNSVNLETSLDSQIKYLR